MLSILRRLISGRPIFTADREHIHHKLLQMGFSHRQVVMVLYAVSALFALLSLFLLWPTGSTLGLVLAVIGTGIWLGVQHLNYLEFGELRRVAQRTIEQREIVINNLAIRRAVEELKYASDFSRMKTVLVGAFENNDFDAFQLEIAPSLLAHSPLAESGKPFHWTKLPHLAAISGSPSWKVSLDLISSSNVRCGTLAVFRSYSQRDLQLDINLLTNGLPVALADALQRVVQSSLLLVPATQNDGILAVNQ